MKIKKVTNESMDHAILIQDAAGRYDLYVTENKPVILYTISDDDEQIPITRLTLRNVTCQKSTENVSTGTTLLTLYNFKDGYGGQMNVTTSDGSHSISIHGCLQHSKTAAIIVYGSNDCNKWQVLGVHKCPDVPTDEQVTQGLLKCRDSNNALFRDLGCTVYSHQVKYLKFALVGDFRGDTTIEHIEMSVYTPQDKIR